MIISKIPVQERPGMHVKVYAAEALRNKRKEWGYGRRWEGNYLLLVSDFYVFTRIYFDFLFDFFGFFIVIMILFPTAILS